MSAVRRDRCANFSSIAWRSAGPVNAATRRAKAGPYARAVDREAAVARISREIGDEAAPARPRRTKSSTTTKSNGSRHSGAARKRSRSRAQPHAARSQSTAATAHRRSFGCRHRGVWVESSLSADGAQQLDERSLPKRDGPRQYFAPQPRAVWLEPRRGATAPVTISAEGVMEQRWGLPLIAWPSRLRPNYWDLVALPMVLGAHRARRLGRRWR